MQGDLISRSALLERINEGAIKFAVSIPSGHVETVNKLVDCFWRELKNVIEEQPTAYDVEKVVEEMNKLLNEELHSVLKPLPDGTEYPEEAYRLLYLNTRLRGLIRNGGRSRDGKKTNIHM